MGACVRAGGRVDGRELAGFVGAPLTISDNLHPKLVCGANRKTRNVFSAVFPFLGPASDLLIRQIRVPVRRRSEGTKMMKGEVRRERSREGRKKETSEFKPGKFLVIFRHVSLLGKHQHIF